MITNKGKSIIAKYLIGQAPSYASHMAIGCGTMPQTFSSYYVIGKFVYPDSVTGIQTVTLGLINLTYPTRSHDIVVGDTVTVAGVGYGIDGNFVVSEVPTTAPTLPLDAANGFPSGPPIHGGEQVDSTVTITPPGGSETTYNVSWVKYEVPGIVDFNDYATVDADMPWYSTVTKNYNNQKSLDFEMFRIPVISRGYVNEVVGDTEVSKLVLTAQLPTEQHYEISEIGLYPAASNPTPQGLDSKILYLFDDNEQWEYHNVDGTKSTIPLVKTRLAQVGEDIDNTNKFFIAGSENITFSETLRVNALEKPRISDNSLFLRGDVSILRRNNGKLVYQPNSEHIHILTPNLDLTKNSPLDELKIAFSVINVRRDRAYDPSYVRVIVEFAGEDHVSGTEPDRYARISLDIKNDSNPGTDPNKQDFSKNRYVVRTVNLKDLYTSTTSFTWADAKVLRVFVSVFDYDVTNPDTQVNNAYPPTSSEYYVALDGLRLENVSSTNSLYGLTGYSVIKNSDETGQYPLTISKPANTSSYIEFKFVTDVI
jgi:hypothetical protein